MVVLVLGMHRSGTSCLAGILNRAGLDLGELTSFYNENTNVWRLHEKVLAENNLTWDNPYVIGSIWWSDECKKMRDGIIEYFEKRDCPNGWGFKDPRTVLLIGGWFDRLEHVKLVGTFRDPWQVAESLRKRDGFDHKKSYKLWYWYNLKLLELHDKFNFPLVNFSDTYHYKDAVKKVLGTLLLKDTSDVLDYFNEKDVHYREDSLCKDDKCLELYEELKRRQVC